MNEQFAVSLEAVFNSIPVGLSVVDRHGRIVLTNPAFRDPLGLPSDVFPPGTLVEDAVRALALRGVTAPVIPRPRFRRSCRFDRSRPGLLLRRTFAGRSFDNFNAPLPDDGYIVTAIETMARTVAPADAESAFAQAAPALTQARAEDEARERARLLDVVYPARDLRLWRRPSGLDVQ